MGSQCCKSSSLGQEEVITQREVSAQVTPNAPLHKASLSQQGSKKSQVEEVPLQEPIEYQLESEQEHKPKKPSLHEDEQADQAEQADLVPEKVMKHVETEAPPLQKAQSGSDVKSMASKKMKLGVDIFVKLREGSIGTCYTLGKVLGQGAFGKVWKGTHKTTGLVRAVKQIKKSSLIREEEQRLFSEMTILKNLDHPHIVKLYELYQDENSYYLVTEYLCGGELFDRIKKMTQFSEHKAADYIKQILLAVVYCHDQNIVHRDLKPENVIFVNEEANAQLKVIDFGTSRKFDGSKQMSKRLGTPYYIAPEVLGHQYNEKCDIWSCGVILYILLCGYPPFVAKTEQQILDKVKIGRYQFDPEDWDTVSKEAKALITKMLTMDPHRRLSARQALEDPWLMKYAPQNQVNLRVLGNLRQFQAKTILKQALISYIVTQMSTQKEVEELQKTFQGLDTNNDGILSRSELIKGYTEVFQDGTMAIQEVERILNEIDINHSGQVDFSEFLMAAMNQEKILSVNKIDQAFKIFDQNGDGFISKQELELVMGDLEDDIWQQILLDCDNNNDGMISFDEFTRMLKNKTM